MNKILVYAMTFGFLIEAPNARAEDLADSKPQFSVGLKAWNSSWLSYLPTVINVNGGASTASFVDAVEGDQRTTLLPVLAVRYKNYFISSSYARYSSNFSVPHSINQTGELTSRSDHIARNETDLTAGYYLMENIAITAGYKYGVETRDSSLGITPGVSSHLYDVTVKGLLFGAFANFPIQGGLRSYWQLGYGPTRVNISFPPASANAPINVHGSYQIGEIGLVYALPLDRLSMTGANVGLGYRSQTLKSRSRAPYSADPRNYRDVKDGVILSLNVSF